VSQENRNKKNHYIIFRVRAAAKSLFRCLNVLTGFSPASVYIYYISIERIIDDARRQPPCAISGGGDGGSINVIIIINYHQVGDDIFSF